MHKSSSAVLWGRMTQERDPASACNSPETHTQTHTEVRSLPGPQA